MESSTAGRYFFAGGPLPSVAVPYCFSVHLTVERHWRVFFMACAELFGYDHGNEWLVGHYAMRINRT